MPPNTTAARIKGSFGKSLLRDRKGETPVYQAP
jgi:hypothetical protein